MELVPDNEGLGNEREWYRPGNFPETEEAYFSPAFLFIHPFKNYHTVWIKKEFEFETRKDKIVYLVFFGADAGKVWLNGEFAGGLTNIAGKQVFDITKLVSEKNTLVIEFDNITPQKFGIWKYIYIMEDSTVPEIAKKIVNSTPKWVDSLILYSVFIRNFTPEGTFNALTAKLPYIKSMGANSIWLLPIHPLGLKERKGTLGSPYAIRDYYEVNPEFGTKDDFRRFVETAHSLDIKVIIDLVINHTSPDSVMKKVDLKFYKPPARQRNLDYGWTDVEELDYDYAPTRKYLTEMMEYWIREFDIDGYRCDTANIIPADFWNESIARIKKLKKNIFMLAEGDDPELHTVGFDLTYDWNMILTLKRIDQGFYGLDQLFEYVQSQFQYFPQYSRRLLCLENHDTPRTPVMYSKKARIPFNILKFILPGVPLIYNGEECGIEATPSLFDRDTIDWTKCENALLDFYREIIKIRKSFSSLNYHFPDGFDYTRDHSHYKVHRFNSEKFVEIVFEEQTLNTHLISNGKLKKTFPAM